MEESDYEKMHVEIRENTAVLDLLISREKFNDSQRIKDTTILKEYTSHHFVTCDEMTRLLDFK